MNTTPQERAAQRAQWQQEQARQIECAKAEMAAVYNLPRDARFDTAWNIAWDLGHSSGISEVKIYFGDLVPLLKP